MRAHLAELEAAMPAMPVEDRAADTWEPLIAVADLAGGGWSELARDACRAMTVDGQDDDGTLGERLLADLREVFGADDRLASATILERLRELEESPWSDLYGRGLDARGLAKLLRPYGVKPKVIRVGSDTPRGYERADLLDPWQRYLPHPQRAQQRNSAGQDAASVADTPTSATDRNALTSDVTDVADVADTPAGPALFDADNHRNPGRHAR